MEKYFSINEQKNSIQCKLYANDARSFDNVIVCCHGFAGSKDSGFARKLAAKVLPSYKTTALLTFDWPCHGSDRRPKLDLEGCDQYLQLVVDYVRNTMQPSRIFANGVSFGGYLLLKYLFEHGNPFERVVLRSPAVAMYESLTGPLMEQGDLEKLYKTKTLAVGFETKIKITSAFVDELRQNDITQWDFRPFADELLLIHGDRDEIVSFATVNQFADDNDLLFLAVEGADHRFVDPVRMSEAVNNTVDFYEL